MKTYTQYKNEVYEPLLYKDSGNKGETEGWQTPSCDTADWKKVSMFQPLEKALNSNIDGAIWLRREIELPKDWEGKDFSLKFSLPGNNALDIYLNGENAAATKGSLDFGWPSFNIPGKLVKGGGNLLAIRFLNAAGQGGAGNIEARTDKMTITLNGEWLCKVEQSRPEVKAPTLPAPREMRAALHNGMIAPLKNYSFKGALWYQGEGNASPKEAGLYETMLKSLITSWRAEFGNPDLYFLTVQLPNYMGRCTKADEESWWAVLRESQSKSLSLPNTGMAVTIDIGEALEIHPKNKQDVGKRLALVARNLCYGEKDLEAYGPTFEELSLEGNAVRLKFSHTTGGLMAQDGALKGFAIAGADGKFVWADARIDGSSVIVSNTELAKPTMVRYNWASNPFGNL